MQYNAELIAVGTELLLGNISNTDAQMLSEGLSTLGINVYYHTVVGDNPQRLREALEIARKRANIIITTGGLGPTYDDLTKQTICAAFGKPLVFHPDILEDIRDFYTKNLHAPMPENNRQQAMLPVGWAVAFAMGSMAIPLAYKYGAEHARVLLFAAFMAPAMLVIAVIGVMAVLEVSLSGAAVTALVCASPLAALAWGYAMYRAACRVFEKKEV